MFRRFATVTGPLIALALAPAAVAGPLPTWTFRTVIETAPGQTELYLGTTAPVAGAAALGQPDAVHAYASLPAGTSGSMTGDGTITLASLSKSAYRLDEAAPGSGAVLTDSFRILLEITDGRSGIRGYTPINGRGELLDGFADGGPPEAVLKAGGAGIMQIAGTRYEYTWRDSASDSVSRVEAVVRVTGSATVTTPEPATLALAGLGLGVIGVRRLRRRG